VRWDSLSARFKRKKARRGEWHPWYAWHPCTDGDVTAWLEWVERRGKPWADDYGSGWEYEYRITGGPRT
jgi:hypothetical protein